MKKFIYSMMALAFTATAFTSCEDVPSPYDNPNNKKNEPAQGTYFEEALTQNLGKFEVNTTKGYGWKIDRNAATVTGYDFTTKTNQESESYLVSPKIDLKGAKEAYLKFGYILNYGNRNSTTRILITKSFNGNPATTQWEDITGTLNTPSTTQWSDYDIYAKDLDAKYLGDTIRIAFHFAAPATESRTWKVKEVLVKEGKASEVNQGGTPTPTPPTTTEGDGTEVKPYTVKDLLAVEKTGNAYVKGFIVGYVYGKDLDGARFSSDTCTVQANILVAADANETDKTKCLAIQLPVGAVRNGVNLATNKTNLKKEVVLYGSLEKYYGTKGVKSVSYAKIDANEFGTKPQDTTGALLSELFTTGQGQFTIEHETALPAALTEVWFFDTRFKCMKAAAYKLGTAYDTNDWLISPAINLSTATSATLTFEQAANYFANLQGETLVKVSENYTGGNPSTATWTTLTPDVYPSNSNFTFVTSTINLTPYVGKANVRIAFQYISTSAKAGTWEIKNVLIK